LTLLDFLDALHEMSIQPNILIPFLYFLVAIPYIGFGLYAWYKRPAAGVIPFAWMVLGMAVWSLGYALEIHFPSLATKLLLVKIEYIGIVSVPVFVLLFALEFTGRSRLLSPRAQFLLGIIPSFVLVLTWTNEFHGLMWDSEGLVESYGLILLDISRNPFYWLNVAYAYLLLLTGNLLLVKEFIHQPGVYRLQTGILILGIVFPWLGNVIHLAKLTPIPNLDLTPLFFLPTAFVLLWAVTRYRLLDLMRPNHISILQNMRDGVIVIDARRRIVYINPITELIFAKPSPGAFGQPLSHLSENLERFAGAHFMDKESHFEFSPGDGPIFEITVSPIYAGNKPDLKQDPGYILILHDITHRKEIEALLSRRETIMEAISLAAEQFLKESFWEHNIPGVLEKIGAALDVSRVYVVMNSSNEEGIVYSSLSYEWAAAGVPTRVNDPSMRNVPLRQAGFARWDDTLREGQPIHGILKDFPDSERAFLKDQKIEALAIMPVFVDRQWWGFIGIDECRRKRAWGNTELGALHAAANILGSAEARARAEQKLLRRQRSLNLLHEIVAESLKTENFTVMSEFLAERLGKLINADGCFLTLWDKASGQTIPLAAYGLHQKNYTSLKIVPGERTFTASAFEAGHTLVVEDVHNSPHVSPRIASLFPTQSALVLPMMAGNNFLGAVLFAFNNHHRFQADEITISEQAASLIALVMEKFQAVEHARRRADESETLRSASAAVTESLKADEAITRILEQLDRVVPYDSASVQLIEGDELKIVGGHGWDNLNDVVGIRFPIPGDNPNTVVVQTGKPYLLPDAGKVYAAFNNPPHNHIHSWLGVPLIFQDRTIGLLAIDSSKPNHFTEENVKLAVTFADRVSIALENARLFSETQNQAITDSLTAVYNRRGLFQLGEYEFARARRIQRPFSAIMLDIDHFKHVNDRYGHATGDQTLRSLAERCQKGSRAMDLVGRYGGEEFVILMPETSLESARLAAERLKQSINTTPLLTDAGPLRVTVSIGVSEMKADDNLQSLIEQADAAMYEAKHAGRNRVATL